MRILVTLCLIAIMLRHTPLKESSENITYINFQIKNNSENRNHFYVVGPKPDGSKFSYGFPMMPNSIRDEYWTLGTKVFLVNGLGYKKPLMTITEKNENQVVHLFN